MTSSEVALTQKKRPALLEVEGLTKAYALRRGWLGRRAELVHALTGVTFDLKRGETLGVVGESGSGKSTLGKTVLRLVEPTFGRIIFDGEDITLLRESRLRSLRRRMQIVFQDPYTSLNPRLVVRDIVGEGIELFNLAKGMDVEELVAQMLVRVGLEPDAMSRYPSEFSGGQRQRIAIARALVVKPDLVICDEPTSALDVSVQAQILNLLDELQSERQVSYLFISHDLRVVELMSHRILVLYLGRVVEIGPTRDVIGRRLHPYTQALFNASPRIKGRQPGSSESPSGAPPGLDDDALMEEDPEDRRRRLKILGPPSSATQPPPGCAFHPRCPRAEKGKCDKDLPSLRALVANPAHRVACHFPG